VPNLTGNGAIMQKPPKGGLQNHYSCIVAYYIFKIGYNAKAPIWGLLLLKIG